MGKPRNPFQMHSRAWHVFERAQREGFEITQEQIEFVFRMETAKEYSPYLGE